MDNECEVDPRLTEQKQQIDLYSEYNKTLRTWLVSFGIAVPAVFVTSSDARDYLQSIPQHRTLIVVFIMGFGLQVFMAFLNKTIAWSQYHKIDCNLKKRKACFLWCSFASLTNMYWIDFLIDIASISCFGYAIYQLIACTPN